MMQELTDEQLMAFVDGELNRQETEKIKKIIHDKPTLQNKVHLFKKSSQLLKTTYDLPAHQEVPERLVNGILKYHGNPKKEKTNKSGFLLIEKIRFLFHTSAWQPVHALVFFLTLSIGIGSGWFGAGLIVSEDKQATFSPFMVSTELSKGLEYSVSGSSFYIDNQNLVITPIITFISISGYYCRQYEVIGKDQETMAPAIGIACRAESGEWITKAILTPSPPTLFPASEEKGFVPAGADDLAGKITSELMAAPPFSLEKEKEIISSGWQ